MSQSSFLIGNRGIIMDTSTRVIVAVDQEGSRGYLWHLRVGNEEIPHQILSAANLYLTVEHAEAAAKSVIERLNNDQIQVIESQYASEDSEENLWNHNGRYEYIPSSFLVDYDERDDGYGYWGMLILDEPIVPSALTYYAKEKQTILDRIAILLKGDLKYHSTAIEDYNAD